MEEKNLNVPQEAVELTDEQMEAVSGGVEAFLHVMTEEEADKLVKIGRSIHDGL